MGSAYAAILKKQTIGSPVTKRLADFDETDPYYLIVKDNGRILAEGEITTIKLVLDESYIYRKIKNYTRNASNMTAVIEY